MPGTGTRRIQKAYEEGGYDASVALTDQIIRATHQYMVVSLGLSEAEAEARARTEIAGTIGHQVCEELAQLQIAIENKIVLDLGAGLGGLSLEMAKLGAHVVGIEPGAGWYRIAHERLRPYHASAIIAAVGEQIPLKDNSVDLIVSLQVLEHVQSPSAVIDEAFRVLKPGGYFYLSYENYFGFREPHYRVSWLPLLPKKVGALYLRLLGRNPQFLEQSVTYTTFHSVRKMLLKRGFQCLRRERSANLLHSGSIDSLKWRLLRKSAFIHLGVTVNLVASVDFAKRLFATAIYECLRKPDLPS